MKLRQGHPLLLWRFAVPFLVSADAAADGLQQAGCAPVQRRWSGDGHWKSRSGRRGEGIRCQIPVQRQRSTNQTAIARV